MNHETAAPVGAPTTAFKSWLCVLCGFVYNEQDGLPQEGIAPGTRWEDVPEGWVCPECGAGKSDFEMTEI
ncbi:rubredoxin [Variovorax sp. YR566]|uniref:rubredoxin n=1 Tax=Variovorax sp. YR566 TaxID=3450237 RepID=UPI003F7D9138